MKDILTLIGADVQLKQAAATNGGEYEGACPFCGGENRFRVWPKTGRYWCRQCNKKGDEIQYIRERDHLGYVDACRKLGAEPQGTAQALRRAARPPAPPLHSPNALWQERAREFIFDCQKRLMDSAEGERALGWLTNRGLSRETISKYGFGYNPVDKYEESFMWGLDKKVWLPRGITIPWLIGGEVWRVNIRRPVKSGDSNKYIGPAGFTNGLFNADCIQANLPIVLLEGEIDALTIQQAAGDLVCAVATGSTSGSRRAKWIARLAMAPQVLVAYDADENGAGDKAADYWSGTLSNARRWRPLWLDVNKMAQDGVDIRAWVQAGLDPPAQELQAETEPTIEPVIIKTEAVFRAHGGDRRSEQFKSNNCNTEKIEERGNTAAMVEIQALMAKKALWSHETARLRTLATELGITIQMQRHDLTSGEVETYTLGDCIA